MTGILKNSQKTPQDNKQRNTVKEKEATIKEKQRFGIHHEQHKHAVLNVNVYV